jgi:hypothetical protein
LVLPTGLITGAGLAATGLGAGLVWACAMTSTAIGTTRDNASGHVRTRPKDFGDKDFMQESASPEDGESRQAAMN